MRTSAPPTVSPIAARTGNQFLCMLLSLCLLSCASADDAPPKAYQLDYQITLTNADTASVRLRVSQDAGQLRTLTFVANGHPFKAFDSETGIRSKGEDIEWAPAIDGGEIRWQAPLNRHRSDGSRDAMHTGDWTMFRAEDVIPAIASKTLAGAYARTTMTIKVPPRWSVVTAYEKDPRGRFLVDDPGRRFDRPDGWILAGDIGVRRDLIADTKVAVAAPRQQQARRLDAMAFLNWHLPAMRKMLPRFPDRLLIAMAGDPFFRGGLSAPNSLFMHTDRPMISGNGTSTLLHELFHVGFSRPAVKGQDWIVEGLAEYYSQQLLWESGTVTLKRHEQTLRALADWGREARTLRGDASGGATTALAVGVFSALDTELRAKSKGKKALSDVVRVLSASDAPISLSELRQAAESALGRPAKSLSDAALPSY